MHFLGQIIQVAGADHILWGTDSIWNGSPQRELTENPLSGKRGADQNEDRHGVQHP